MREITQAEKDFCDLYIFGSALFSYKADTCYMRAMEGFLEGDIIECSEDPIKKSKYIQLGKKLLRQKHIKEHIKALIREEDQDYRRESIREMLIGVYHDMVLNASNTSVTNEDGSSFVPASQRAVAIQAGKALAELISIKDTDEDNGKGTANITLTITPHID